MVDTGDSLERNKWRQVENEAAQRDQEAIERSLATRIYPLERSWYELREKWQDPQQRVNAIAAVAAATAKAGLREVLQRVFEAKKAPSGKPLKAPELLLLDLILDALESPEKNAELAPVADLGDFPDAVIKRCERIVCKNCQAPRRAPASDPSKEAREGKWERLGLEISVFCEGNIQKTLSREQRDEIAKIHNKKWAGKPREKNKGKVWPNATERDVYSCHRKMKSASQKEHA